VSTTSPASPCGIGHDGMPAHWPSAFQAVSTTWTHVAPRSWGPKLVSDWRRQLDQLAAEQQRLDQAGRWRPEPRDLLTICRVQHRELVHSAALAWLCDPTGDHGLGDAFLTRFLGLARRSVHLVGHIDVDTEVSRPTSRADLVIQADAWTVVAELKVDASESYNQCQRLYDDWKDEPDLRLILITPLGRSPATVRTSAARAAWHTASWRQILDVLEDAIRSRPSPLSAAVEQYRLTLRGRYGRRPR
jgi:hypothetical protein